MERLSSESDDEEMGEEELTGLAAKMARQAKFMKQKVGMEDDEDEEEEEEKQRAVWGRGKKIYYGADNVNYEEQSSDEEAPAEEEEAIRELQQNIAATLRPEDFDYDDSEEEDASGEDTFEEAAGKESQPKTENKTSTDKVITDGTIELKKDITALSKKEQMDILMSDAPELAGLTPELRDNLNELRTKVLPLLEKMRQCNGATEDGIRYVELKHMLLLSYCQAIVFYLLLKAEAQDVKDHPVVGRLVDLKLSIKRLQLVEERMQKQIEKLLTSDMTDVIDKETRSKEMNGNSQALKKRKAANLERKSKKRRALIENSANGTDCRSEEAENALGIESQQMVDERKRLDARAQGEPLAHVPTSNAARRKAKRHKSSSGLTRMADDLEDDVQKDDNVLKTSHGMFDSKPRTLSQVIAQAGRPLRKPQIISGDSDLPVREDLGERRRMLDIQKTNKNLDAPIASDDGFDDSVPNDPEEDDVFKQARLLKEAKEATKQEKDSSMPLTLVEEEEDEEEEDADGKRSITWQMEKNRGLTPHRKKGNKNPRKKYKLKHEKAVMRRKGQVRDIRVATTNYGGEASGIRTNISRSCRFRN